MDNPIADLAARIANKFLNHGRNRDRMDFVLRRNFTLGCKVIDYPEDDAAQFIDDMAHYHIETNGLPLSYAKRHVPRGA